MRRGGLKIQIRQTDGEISTQDKVERIIFNPENFELILGIPHRRHSDKIPTHLIAQADIRDDEPGSELALRGGETIVKP